MFFTFLLSFYSITNDISASTIFWSNWTIIKIKRVINFLAPNQTPGVANGYLQTMELFIEKKNATIQGEKAFVQDFVMESLVTPLPRLYKVVYTN